MGNGQQIAKGARIVHPDFGPGLVRRLRRGGRSLQVNFDGNPKLLLEVEAREVELEAVGDAAPEAPTAPPNAIDGTAAGESVAASAPTPMKTRRAFRQADPALSGTNGSDEAAQTLEALRLGVVPHADLRQSSVGRDAELALVSRDLDAAERGGAARVFLGDYGTGKTHLLELIEREALGRGFLVGRATLDAQYVMPNHPMRVYRSVVSSLVYPDRDITRGEGLDPLLARATGDEAFQAALTSGEDPLCQHLYLAPALHYYRVVSEQDDPLSRDLLLDWIEGQRPEGNQELDAALRKLGTRGPTIYSLKDFQPWAHVYAYLLGGVGALARRVGYAGVVILVDEAENYDLLGSASRAFADTVFRCLVLAAAGEDGVSFSPDEIVKGGFPPQKRLPIVFDWPQHLYFVSAMTPSTAGEELLRRLVPDNVLVELSQLSLDDYHELSRRVTTLFEAAHPEMSLPERLNRPLGEVMWALIRSQQIGNARDATKLTVEFLDLLRLKDVALGAFFEDVERSLSGE